MPENEVGPHFAKGDRASSGELVVSRTRYDGKQLDWKKSLHDKLCRPNYKRFDTINTPFYKITPPFVSVVTPSRPPVKSSPTSDRLLRGSVATRSSEMLGRSPRPRTSSLPTPRLHEARIASSSTWPSRWRVVNACVQETHFSTPHSASCPDP